MEQVSAGRMGIRNRATRPLGKTRSVNRVFVRAQGILSRFFLPTARRRCVPPAGGNGSARIGAKKCRTGVYAPRPCIMGKSGAKRKTPSRQAELTVRQFGVSEAGTPDATRDRINRPL